MIYDPVKHSKAYLLRNEWDLRRLCMSSAEFISSDLAQDPEIVNYRQGEYAQLLIKHKAWRLGPALRNKSLLIANDAKLALSYAIYPDFADNPLSQDAELLSQRGRHFGSTFVGIVAAEHNKRWGGTPITQDISILSLKGSDEITLAEHLAENSPAWQKSKAANNKEVLKLNKGRVAATLAMWSTSFPKSSLAQDIEILSLRSGRVAVNLSKQHNDYWITTPAATDMNVLSLGDFAVGLHLAENNAWLLANMDNDGLLSHPLNSEHKLTRCMALNNLFIESKLANDVDRLKQIEPGVGVLLSYNDEWCQKHINNLLNDQEYLLAPYDDGYVADKLANNDVWLLSPIASDKSFLTKTSLIKKIAQNKVWAKSEGAQNIDILSLKLDINTVAFFVSKEQTWASTAAAQELAILALDNGAVAANCAKSEDWLLSRAGQSAEVLKLSKSVRLSAVSNECWVNSPASRTEDILKLPAGELTISDWMTDHESIIELALTSVQSFFSFCTTGTGAGMLQMINRGSIDKVIELIPKAVSLGLHLKLPFYHTTGAREAADKLSSKSANALIAAICSEVKYAKAELCYIDSGRVQALATLFSATAITCSAIAEFMGMYGYDVSFDLADEVLSELLNEINQQGECSTIHDAFDKSFYQPSSLPTYQAFLLKTINRLTISANRDDKSNAELTNSDVSEEAPTPTLY